MNLLRSAVPALLLAVCSTGCIGVRGQAAMANAGGRTIADVAREAQEVALAAPFEESLTPGAAPQRAELKLEPRERFQTLEGFGAAVGWYQDLIIGPTINGLYEFLFPELGLDILRFRNRFERSDPRDATLEQELEIYQRATKALGYAPRVLLSSWSPPARLKANGKEKCKSNPDCTLKKQNGKFPYDDFADWWSRSLEAHAKLGIGVDYVSIQNEADFIPPDWEGCKFEPRETDEYPSYAKALAAVHQRISKLPKRPKLLGPEVLGIHYERVQKYMSSLDPALLDGVAHHIYERGNDSMWDWREPGPDSFNDEMRAVAEITKAPLYQTEFGTDEDKGIDGGFETAWLIHNSLVEEGAVAFLYWELVWPSAKGLVGMRGRNPEPRDQYYSLRHYARFTDPGYRRVRIDSSEPALRASAFLRPDEKQLAIVALNTGKIALDVTLAPAGFRVEKSQAYRTSYRPGHTRRWEEMGTPSPSGLRLPARAVVTLVLDGTPSSEATTSAR